MLFLILRQQLNEVFQQDSTNSIHSSPQRQVFRLRAHSGRRNIEDVFFSVLIGSLFGFPELSTLPVSSQTLNSSFNNNNTQRNIESTEQLPCRQRPRTDWTDGWWNENYTSTSSYGSRLSTRSNNVSSKFTKRKIPKFDVKVKLPPGWGKLFI